MVIREIYRQMQQVMAQNPNSDPAFEAGQLIEFVTGKKRIDVMNDEADDETLKKLVEYANQRKEGYPLQYIIGKWQFFDMELHVGEGVLVPRQDTETVCESAFEVIGKLQQPKVLDLCSGSGCIALAVKRFCPQAQVTAVEKSEQAFAYLEKNIAATGFEVKAVKDDIMCYYKTLEDESVDVIVSNPPYIDFIFKPDLQTEVAHEPEMALFAEENGLFFYKFITEHYYAKLKKGGYLVFEYGFDQQEAVREIITEKGYTIVEEIIDMAQNPRGAVAKK